MTMRASRAMRGSWHIRNMWGTLLLSPHCRAPHTYDQYGRRSTIARNGGAGAGTTYGYDGADRVSSLAQALTGASAITWTMTYDPAGGLVSRQASNTSYLWHPGAASVASTANGLSQYTTVGGAAMGYDARANLASNGAKTQTLTYDSRNALLTASGPTAVSLAYDPAGRIVTKTASGATASFLYAGSRLIGEYDASGNILARYIPGPGTDEAALWYQGAGTANPNWLHADPQGSTIAWSNGSGSVQGTQAYDPYGQPQAWSGPRYAYTGQLMLPEAQLYHYKARAYDPVLGRFAQTDPIGYASDINPYAYVMNDPVDGVDPSGLVTETLIVTAIRHWFSPYISADLHATSISDLRPSLNEPGDGKGDGNPSPSNPPECTPSPGHYNPRATPHNLPAGWSPHDNGDRRTNQFMQNARGELSLTPDYYSYSKGNYDAVQASNTRVGFWLGVGPTGAGVGLGLTLENTRWGGVVGGLLLAVPGLVSSLIGQTPPPPPPAGCPGAGK